MLDQRFTFKILSPREPLEAIEQNITTDPPPGIDAIPDAKVVKIEDHNEIDHLVYAHVEMSLEDFVHSGVQYDIDVYEILADIRRDAGPDAAKAAHEWLQTKPALTKTVIDTTGDQLTHDQYPTNPDL